MSRRKSRAPRRRGKLVDPRSLPWCLVLVGLEISRTWSISSVALVSLVELILSKASYHSTISCPMKYQGHIMAGFGATPPGYLEG